MATGLKLSSKSFGTADELTDYMTIYIKCTQTHTANDTTDYDTIELTVKK